MKSLIVLLTLITAVVFASCDPMALKTAPIGKITAVGSVHKIELYNGGQLIKSWEALLDHCLKKALGWNLLDASNGYSSKGMFLRSLAYHSDLKANLLRKFIKDKI